MLENDAHEDEMQKNYTNLGLNVACDWEVLFWQVATIISQNVFKVHVFQNYLKRNLNN